MKLQEWEQKYPQIEVIKYILADIPRARVQKFPRTEENSQMYGELNNLEDYVIEGEHEGKHMLKGVSKADLDAATATLTKDWLANKWGMSGSWSHSMLQQPPAPTLSFRTYQFRLDSEIKIYENDNPVKAAYHVHSVGTIGELQHEVRRLIRVWVNTNLIRVVSISEADTPTGVSGGAITVWYWT